MLLIEARNKDNQIIASIRKYKGEYMLCLPNHKITSYFEEYSEALESLRAYTKGYVDTKEVYIQPLGDN
jgi:hypothetical protein